MRSETTANTQPNSLNSKTTDQKNPLLRDLESKGLYTSDVIAQLMLNCSNFRPKKLRHRSGKPVRSD